MVSLQHLQLFFVFFIYSICGSISITFDSHHEERKIKRIAFGSCSNNGRFALDYLQNIKNIEPDIWLWTGNIVYGRTKHGTDLSNIRKNYDALKSNIFYKSLVSSNVIIEGVYDDHDIGMNDADDRLSESVQREAQQLLLNFLDIHSTHPRRQRNGVYSVHKIDDVMIIMLDTPAHRTSTSLIPSIGKWEYPFFAWFASYIRYLSAYFGFSDDHRGSVLSDVQWKWFEQILKSNDYKTSKLVLIVSSTQVLSSNPFFESWGHFPFEKRKLLRLLKESITDNDEKEPHILFISGDVHHAELLRGNEEYGPLEVTSSGITHSLSNMGHSIKGKIFSSLSTHITETYRTNYTKGDSVYYGRNFGVIEIENDNAFNLKIYDANSGKNVIQIPLNKDKKCCLLKDVLSEINDERMCFPRKLPFYGMEFILATIFCLIGMWVIFRRAIGQISLSKPKTS